MLYRKDFNTQEEFLDALVANKQILIDAKKSEIKTKDCAFSLLPSKDATKAVGDGSDIGFGDTIYAVINTTNFMDSHEDVHAKSIWNKSAKEQNGKVYFVTDHKIEFGKIISNPKDVNIILRDLEWSELGVDLKGTTRALIFETKLHEYASPDYVRALKSGMPIQHSIRMRYIEVVLAVNSDKYEDEYKNWKLYIDEVANKDVAEENGYFYFVKEAAIAMEGSAVPFGSNSATPTLTELPKQQNQSTEPTKVTQEVRSNKYSYYKTNH